MREEIVTTVAKAAAGGMASGATAMAVFGLSWWAWAAAMVGAAAQFHFELDRAPETLLKLVIGIAAVGFAAAMLASGIPHFPYMGWTSNILVEVRAGLLGLVANPAIHLLRRLISTTKHPQGGG